MHIRNFHMRKLPGRSLDPGTTFNVILFFSTTKIEVSAVPAFVACGDEVGAAWGAGGCSRIDGKCRSRQEGNGCPAVGEGDVCKLRPTAAFSQCQALAARADAAFCFWDLRQDRGNDRDAQLCRQLESTSPIADAMASTS
jgi:hypothetical protein